MLKYSHTTKKESPQNKRLDYLSNPPEILPEEITQIF